MVTWKDNFECFYSEVAELGRYGGTPGAPPKPAKRETVGAHGGSWHILPAAGS